MKVIRVQRRLRRGVRRPTRKYNGQRGWNWIEIEFTNQFTNVDNMALTAQTVATGQEFNTPVGTSAVGGSENKTVVFRRIIGQFFLTAIPAEEGQFPFTAYDVALVKWEALEVLQSPQFLLGVQMATNNRVLWHQRVWAGHVPGTYEPLETEVPFSTVSASNVVRFDIKPNVPLAEGESLGMVLSQAGSELYTDTQSAILAGFVKSYVQIK